MTSEMGLDDPPPASVVGTSVPDIDSRAVPINELAVESSGLSSDIREALQWASEYVEQLSETQPGSFEPFIAGDWENLADGGWVATADDGSLRGRLLVANPSNQPFFGTVLCLINLEPGKCTIRSTDAPTDPRERKSEGPGIGSHAVGVIPNGQGLTYETEADDVSVGDEITVMFVVANDRQDPLPASQALTVLAGPPGSVAGREFREARALDGLEDCKDRPVLAVDSELRGRTARRDARVRLDIESCSERGFVPFLIRNTTDIVTPSGWNPVKFGPGMLQLTVPPELSEDPATRSLQAGVVVYRDAGAPVAPFVFFAEELVFEN